MSINSDKKLIEAAQKLAECKYREVIAEIFREIEESGMLSPYFARTEAEVLVYFNRLKAKYVKGEK